MKTYLAVIADKYTSKQLTKICEIRANSSSEVVDEMKIKYPNLVQDVEEERAYVDIGPNWT